MKNKRVLIGVIIAVIALAGIYFLTNQRSSYFIVENNDNGSIAVTAQKATKNSSGIGYVTLTDGQKLSVRSNFTDNSSVKFEVFPAEMDDTTKVLLEETVTAIDARRFELPAGKYTIRITTVTKTEGTMDIKPE